MPLESFRRSMQSPNADGMITLLEKLGDAPVANIALISSSMETELSPFSAFVICG